LLVACRVKFIAWQPMDCMLGLFRPNIEKLKAKSFKNGLYLE
jgi:hypothetical protein